MYLKYTKDIFTIISKKSRNRSRLRVFSNKIIL